MNMLNQEMNHEDAMTLFTSLENCAPEQRAQFLKSILPNTMLQEQLRTVVDVYNSKKDGLEKSVDSKTELSKSFFTDYNR